MEAPHSTQNCAPAEAHASAPVRIVPCRERLAAGLLLGCWVPLWIYLFQLCDGHALRLLDRAARHSSRLVSRFLTGSFRLAPAERFTALMNAHTGLTFLTIPFAILVLLRCAGKPGFLPGRSFWWCLFAHSLICLLIWVNFFCFDPIGSQPIFRRWEFYRPLLGATIATAVTAWALHSTRRHV